MRKFFSLFAALTLSVGLWAAAPAIGDVFPDNVSGLNFEVTSLDPKTVKVFPSNETGTACEVPATVSYNDVTFAVTEIGESAFQAWNFLQSITLPESVTTIGKMAFYYCISLQSVSIDGVQTIGTQAFQGCESLQSIVWSNVTTIENNAFDGCGFTSLTFPATLTTIGAEAFVGCTSLQEVTFSSNCTIEEDAFIGVGGDPYVLLTLPADWTGAKPDEEGLWYGGLFELYEAPATPEVGDQFVDATSGLKFEVTSLEPKTVKVIQLGDEGPIYEGTSYTVPATVSYLNETFAVTEIGRSAFMYCGIESITLPESMVTLGDFAFAGCWYLQSITCGTTTPPTCGEDCFVDVPFSTTVYVPAGAGANYMEADDWNRFNIIDPTTPLVGNQFVDAASGLKFQIISLDPKAVMVIGNGYEGTNYEVPATVTYKDVIFSVTEIGGWAFNSCENLQSITLPNSVTKIEQGAFESCFSLQTITMPNVTAIEGTAFYYCTSLQSIICETTTPPTCGEYCFDHTPRPSVYVPAGAGVNYIAADEWKKLNIIDPTTPLVGNQFVDAASGLKFQITSLDPKTVMVVRNSYQGTSYEIPTTVTHRDLTFTVTAIGDWAFNYCENLQSITLPATITTIGNEAFAGCGLQTISMPNVENIGESAFSDCANLQTISMPNVETLGYAAFAYCSSLQSLTLPASVESIGEWAFSACSVLASVTVSWTSNIPTPGEYAFEGIATPAILHVPAGTKALYEAAGWDTWFTIEAAPATFTLTGKSANQYATICLPQPIASVSNAVLYKISYGDVYKVNFVEETNFTEDPAGTPYLVQAIADGDIVFTMTDATPVTDPVGVEAAKGFVASLQEEMQDIPEGYEYLLVSGGALHSAGAGCLLSKNHAYIDVNYVPETEPVVPGAPRRVTLYNAEAQSPTGLGQSAITNHKSAMKVVKNGQFVIVRDNMKYNAQGQIIK